jgi:hypothetical protein
MELFCCFRATLQVIIGRLRHRWEDNIKMDLQEVGWTELIWLRIGTGGGLL